MRTTLSFVVAVAVLGCGSKSTETQATGSGTGTAAGTGAAVAPASTGTHVFVDDADVATVTAAQVASWPRVDTLVPEAARRLGKWQAIYIKGAKPQVSELNKPFETYRDYVPALFPGEGGKISFGLFDPVELGKKGKPALQEDGVLELRIKLAGDTGRGENDHGGGSATDPAELQLKIKTAKGEQILTGEKLLALPREAMPGGGGDAKGWKLVALLEVAGVKTWDKLLLKDAAGLSLTIEHKDLDDKTVPFVKLNRQGSLRFRIFKQQGEGWTPSGDLRALTSIEVLK
ncbi:MAG: hypothetical protein IPQ07_38875 [Myxococcales bacterium]|nr:hypothetical protein [Myxococcales bacterium]